MRVGERRSCAGAYGLPTALRCCAGPGHDGGMAPQDAPQDAPLVGGVPLDVLEQVQRRVLWLATSIVHHANHVRTTSSGVKVGGHQASSASMVSIMTALYFASLRPEDRVSVKPHAAPVLHAVNYLMGRLDPAYLTQLRAFKGLQSYPSRTKDPDPVDFSTGSVGIGATATIWSALAHRYVGSHFEVAPSRPSHRADGRRRARRGGGLGGTGRPDGLAARRGPVGGGPQPAEPRPDRAEHRHASDRGHVRGGGLEHHHAEVRAPAPGDVRAARWRRAVRPDRRHGQPGVPAPPPVLRRGGPAPPGRRGKWKRKCKRKRECKPESGRRSPPARCR